MIYSDCILFTGDEYWGWETQETRRQWLIPERQVNYIPKKEKLK